MATNSIRLDQNLIEKATIIAKALNRTPPKQIEHWAKIGEMMEDNPDLPYEFVRQAIIAQAERDAGKLTEVLAPLNMTSVYVEDGVGGHVWLDRHRHHRWRRCRASWRTLACH